jgi:hypothetical protein
METDNVRTEVGPSRTTAKFRKHYKKHNMRHHDSCKDCGPDSNVLSGELKDLSGSLAVLLDLCCEYLWSPAA